MLWILRLINLYIQNTSWIYRLQLFFTSCPLTGLCTTALHNLKNNSLPPPPSDIFLLLSARTDDYNGDDGVFWCFRTYRLHYGPNSLMIKETVLHKYPVLCGKGKRTHNHKSRWGKIIPHFYLRMASLWWTDTPILIIVKE